MKTNITVESKVNVVEHYKRSYTTVSILPRTIIFFSIQTITKKKVTNNLFVTANIQYKKGKSGVFSVYLSFAVDVLRLCKEISYLIPDHPFSCILEN